VAIANWKNTHLAIGAFAAGLIATPLIIFAVFQLPDRWADAIGLLLIWPWWLIAKYGTRALPADMSGAYDPFGHPIMHVLGVAANALYLGAVLYLVFRGFLRAKERGSTDAT
jgi:hypothetical protein